MAYCPFCREMLPPDASWCPQCQRAVPKDLFDVPSRPPVAAPSRAPVAAPSRAPAAPESPGRLDNAAIYTLELAARCPYCQGFIRTVRVLRMHRSQAAFTSTLPRSGRAVVCPKCERILTIELGVLA